MHRVTIYENGQYSKATKTAGRPLPASSVYPYEVKLGKLWYPATITPYGLRVDIDTATEYQRPTATPKTAPSKATPTATRPQAAPSNPTANEVTYEAWKAGKLGKGEKVTAPRGMGQEWAARLYCEKALERAKYYSRCNNSKKQYRAGSYNDRRRQGHYQDRRMAWQEGIETAEAVINMPLDGNWTYKKELVQDALSYASCLLQMVG